MQALIVEFRIQPEHVQHFAEAIADNARASRDSEAGCRQFDVCRDPDDPSLFFLYELYDDAAAIDAHLAAPHYLHFAQASAGWVEHKAVRRYERVAP